MSKNKSFTLIELLVVIVIIGILAGVIMISTSSSIDKANFAKAQTFSNTVQNELLSNLVSEWTFDEGINQTINRIATNDDVKDSWGINHGTVNGNPQIKGGSDCVSGRCMSFDGVDDYVDFGGGTLNFKKEDSFTFSVWVKRTGTISGTSKVAGILMNGNGLGRYGIDYYQIGNQVRCGVREASSYDKNATPNNNLLGWHHIVFSYNSNSSNGISLYLNGVFEGSRTSLSVTTLAKETLKIAKNNTLGGDTNYFPGLFDDIRVYSSALSSSQIKQNYIAGLSSMLSNGNISKQEYNERISNLAIVDF